MANTLHGSAVTTPDKALVSARPKMAKAALHDNGGQDHADPLSEVVLPTAKEVYGKQGAAAAQLGKNEGNFSRDAKAGRLTTRDLHALGPQFLAKLGEHLVQQYGPLSDPKDAARKSLDRIEDEVRQLRQFVEDVA